MLKEIGSRRSIRKYKDKEVPDNLIDQIIESGRLAPSGNNSQPWHFITVRNRETRQRISDAAHNQQWMMTAPLFLVCVADTSVRIQENGYRVDENSPEMGVKKVIRDTAIAAEHMVLEAESLGLGTCWIAWFEQDRLRPVLGIPEDKFVLCVLTMGYPDEAPEARPRRKTEEFLHREKW